MIKFNESSTKTGLMLLGSVAAGLLTGQTDLINVTMAESGAQLGGIIPTIAAAGIGLWDVVRKERKE